jgi:hypothetical protein
MYSSCCTCKNILIISNFQLLTHLVKKLSLALVTCSTNTSLKGPQLTSILLKSLRVLVVKRHHLRKTEECTMYIHLVQWQQKRTTVNSHTVNESR